MCVCACRAHKKKFISWFVSDAFREQCLHILSKQPDARDDHDMKTLHVILDSVGFFKRLPSSLHLRVGRLLTYQHFTPGELLMVQGDEGDALYLLMKGKASVFVGKKKKAVLSDGDEVGEWALLHGGKRSATVMASTHIDALVLSKDNYDFAIRKYRRKAVHERADFISRMSLFSSWKGHTKELIDLVNVLKPKRFEPAQAVIREGDPSDSMFFIVKGTLCVTRTVYYYRPRRKHGNWKGEAGDLERHSRQVTLATLHAGDFFGESAVLSPKPRAATVTVVDAVAEVLVLERNNFDRILHFETPVLLEMKRMRVRQ